MSGRARLRQAALLVRVRTVRRDAAARALDQARNARAVADEASRAADRAATDADRTLDRERHGLIVDPDEAELRLALVGRTEFDRSLARTAAAEAAEEVAKREADELARRRIMVLADARHRVLADHVASLRRRDRRRNEDRTETDMQDARRPR